MAEKREFVQDLKDNIHDAVVRKGNKVFVGRYTHDDGKVYNVFVTVEERQ